MFEPSQQATEALVAHAAGDPRAVSRLVPLVYVELRKLASRLMRRERREHTLQPTALVHEAYLRLIDNTRIDWQGKTHFLAIAAKEMRQILVQHARAHKARKRGAGATRVTLDENVVPTPERTFDVLAVDEALDKLSALSPRQGQVVELRYFAGLSVNEAAYALGVSERTVKQDWQVARTWLMRELTSPPKD